MLLEAVEARDDTSASPAAPRSEEVRRASGQPQPERQLADAPNPHPEPTRLSSRGLREGSTWNRQTSTPESSPFGFRSYSVHPSQSYRFIILDWRATLLLFSVPPNAIHWCRASGFSVALLEPNPVGWSAVLFRLISKDVFISDPYWLRTPTPGRSYRRKLQRRTHGRSPAARLRC